jgi:hypothetical protein
MQESPPTATTTIEVPNINGELYRFTGLPALIEAIEYDLFEPPTWYYTDNEIDSDSGPPSSDSDPDDYVIDVTDLTGDVPGLEFDVDHDPVIFVKGG